MIVGWRSSVYGFFKAKVSIGYDEGQKFHFFKCASKNCKGKGHKGVRRYLDLKDRLQCPISRVVHLDALVKIWSSPHSKINDLKAEMDRYLQCLLARAKSPSKYHIVLILLKKLGEYFNQTLSFCSNL